MKRVYDLLNGNHQVSTVTYVAFLRYNSQQLHGGVALIGRKLISPFH